MPWFLLFVAGLLEICWAVGLKYTNGFSRPVPTALTLCAMVLSMALLGLAVRTLPIGTAYAVWTGIGVIGTAVWGILYLNETVSVARLLCVALILTGIVGLKLISPPS